MSDNGQLVTVPKAVDLVAGIVPAHRLLSWEPESIGQAMGLAEVLANSTIIPTALRDKPGNVLAIMMFGRELGLSTMQSILGIWIEPRSGRPTMYAQTLVGLVKRSKLCQWFVCEHTAADRATFATQRVGSPAVARLTVTIAEYAHMLTKEGDTKANWKNNPAAMLRARASIGLARMVYEEIAAGIYDPDELDEGPVMTAPPPPRPAAPPPPSAAGPTSPPTTPAGAPPATGDSKAPFVDPRANANARRAAARPAQAKLDREAAKAPAAASRPPAEGGEFFGGEQAPPYDPSASIGDPDPAVVAGKDGPRQPTPEEAARIQRSAAFSQRMFDAKTGPDMDVIGAGILAAEKRGELTKDDVRALLDVFNGEMERIAGVAK